MFSLELKASPTSYDEYGQPCYPVDQEKGLSEAQGNRLLKEAFASGYTAAVAKTLVGITRRQVLLASSQRPADVLEIGGGNGGFYDGLRNKARTYINVEPGRIPLSGKALERIKDPRYMCLKCSAEDIPLPDESVDVILCIASFDHIPDYRKALGEVRRLLRKGGIFMLTLNNRRSWWKAMLSRTAYLKRREEEIAKEHYFQWSFSECESHLAEFIPVRDIYTTTFVPFIPHLWRPLLPVSDLFGRPLLRKYGANIIAVCRKPGKDGSHEFVPRAI
ncbi:MAG: methyltransferase domain-containing protein [Pyrinomonadaceae bacterium]|nr:methyltransferase domain-containing protein [Pyrinomonadaceae bacterium]